MTEADEISTDELKRLTIFEDGMGTHVNAGVLFESIRKHQKVGKSVVISMPGDQEHGMPDFDFAYNVIMSNHREAMLQRDSRSSDSAPDFLHVQLTDGENHLEMYQRDMQYGSTFIGNVCSIRPARR